jgi:hypothetical protein
MLRLKFENHIFLKTRVFEIGAKMDADVFDRHAADLLYQLVNGTLARGGDFSNVLQILEKLIGSTVLVASVDGRQLQILRTLVNNVKINMAMLRQDPDVQKILADFAEHSREQQT